MKKVKNFAIVTLVAIDMHSLQRILCNFLIGICLSKLCFCCVQMLVGVLLHWHKRLDETGDLSSLSRKGMLVFCKNKHNYGKRCIVITMSRVG